MKKFLGVLGFLVLLNWATAAACPPASTSYSAVSLPALPYGGDMYYCAVSAAPTTIGDLTAAGWAKNVQICSRTCSYERMDPSDPHSLLIPGNCGPGLHDMTYYVQPPAGHPGRATMQLTDPSCKASAPTSGGGSGLRF